MNACHGRNLAHTKFTASFVHCHNLFSNPNSSAIYFSKQNIICQYKDFYIFVISFFVTISLICNRYIAKMLHMCCTENIQAPSMTVCKLYSRSTFLFLNAKAFESKIIYRDKAKTSKCIV